jgi:hypothetical protein
MIEFFNSIGQTLYFAKTVFIIYARMGSQKVVEYVKNFNPEHQAFQACFYANQCKAFVQQKLAYLYNNNKIVNKYVNLVNYGAVWLYAYLQCRRTEPFVKSWTCVSALVKSYYTYNQFIYRFNDLYDKKPLINVDDYATALQTVIGVVKSETAITECLVTLKIDNKYIHRICNPATLFRNADASKILFDQSDVKFLSIEYHSTDYLNPQVLEIDKNELLVNNEILSMAFVKRALEYQIPYHRFNKNYKILLMDNNLKTVSLNQGEYIVLHKNYYSIMNEEGLRENIYSNRDQEIVEQTVANE